MDRSQFLKDLKLLFPELRGAINKEMGQLHLEVNVLHLYAQALIAGEEKEMLSQVYDLANRGYVHGNTKLRSAIDVSFVEGLKFKEREWAWENMPQELKNLYVSFHGKSPILK